MKSGIKKALVGVAGLFFAAGGAGYRAYLDRAEEAEQAKEAAAAVTTAPRRADNEGSAQQSAGEAVSSTAVAPVAVTGEVVKKHEQDCAKAKTAAAKAACKKQGPTSLADDTATVVKHGNSVMDVFVAISSAGKINPAKEKDAEDKKAKFSSPVFPHSVW